MTKRLYETDGHLADFSATVLSCIPAGKHFLVALDHTAFFPEGGGQAADTGILGGVRVVDVQLLGDEILHETELPLKSGATVTGQLDWEQRLRRMQNHTGEHLICGLIHTHFGLDNVGFHLGSDVVTVDVNGVLSWTQLLQIEWEANRAVAENVPVTVSFPDADVLPTLSYRSKLDLTEDVRVVTIEGYDRCACCAPHVSRTGEIGCIKILDSMHYKGGTRFYLLCGLDALADYNERLASVAMISKTLSAKQTEIADAVKRLLEERDAERHTSAGLRQQMLKLHLESIAFPAGHVCLFEPFFDPNMLRRFVNEVIPQCEGVCIACSGSDVTGYHYILASRTIALGALRAPMHAALGGKGGGTDTMQQGSLNATQAQIREWIHQIPLPNEPS